jgi:hypothetical protein
MMGNKHARNTQRLIDKTNWRKSIASGWFSLRRISRGTVGETWNYITMLSRYVILTLKFSAVWTTGDFVCIYRCQPMEPLLEAEISHCLIQLANDNLRQYVLASSTLLPCHLLNLWPSVWRTFHYERCNWKSNKYRHLMHVTAMNQLIPPSK